LEADKRMEDDPQEDGHSYKEQLADSRMKFLEEKMMTKMRDIEERMGQRTSLMESRIGSVECRLKN